MGRKIEESTKIRIHNAIITATIFGSKLFGGRDSRRNGVLDMAAILFDALRRR
jgi:hypothetical protein